MSRSIGLVIFIAILCCITSCHSPVQGENEDTRGQNIPTITGMSTINASEQPPGFDEKTFEESSPIKGFWAYTDNDGNLRAYYMDNKDFAYHKEEIRQEIERLKTGSLMNKDLNMLDDGTQVELELLYVPSDYPTPLELQNKLTYAAIIDDEGYKNEILLPEFMPLNE